MVNQHSSPDIATLHIRPGVLRDLGGERKGTMRYDLSTANDPRTDIRIKTNTKQGPTKVKTPISDHSPPLVWGVCVILRMIYRAYEVEARHYRSSVTHSLYRVLVSFRQDGDPIKKAVACGGGRERWVVVVVVLLSLAALTCSELSLCFRVTKERRILFPHFPYRIPISIHRRDTARFVMPI